MLAPSVAADVIKQAIMKVYEEADQITTGDEVVVNPETGEHTMSVIQASPVPDEKMVDAVTQGIVALMTYMQLSAEVPTPLGGIGKII